jgi:hypothetical protein
MTVAIASQRNFQTMGPILATPSKRPTLFPGPEPPGVSSALQTCTSGRLVSASLLGFRSAPRSLPGLARAVVVPCGSGTSLVMSLGAVGPGFGRLPHRQHRLLPRLLPGGVEARSRLPAALRDLAQRVPLIHGMEAGPMLAQGGWFRAAAPDHPLGVAGGSSVTQGRLPAVGPLRTWGQKPSSFRPGPRRSDPTVQPFRQGTPKALNRARGSGCADCSRQRQPRSQLGPTPGPPAKPEPWLLHRGRPGVSSGLRAGGVGRPGTVRTAPRLWLAR